MFQKEENEKDIRLALAWQQGDTEAGEELLLKYMPLIMRASAHHYSSCDWEDMRQDLTIAFLESAKDYTPTLSVPFSAFIKKRILWARAKKMTQLQSIEAHESLDLEKQEEGYYEIEPPLCLDMEKIASAAHLTKKQQLIFPFWLQGKTVIAMHHHTGLSIRSIQRIIQRMQKSLQAHAQEISACLTANN